MIELKPCPHDHSKLEEELDYKLNAAVDFDSVGTDEGRVFFAECLGCGATGPNQDTRAEAIAAWNRRAGEWVSVEEPPDPGRPVILLAKNSLGKTRRLRAQWSDGKSVPASDDGDGWSVYDEEADEYWCPEGWFETNEYEETHWQVEDTPLMWTELPEPPPEADRG